MCGIVAYIGRKVAQPLLIEGLKRLEYRGYDSAGIAVIDTQGKMHIRRAVGRISARFHNTLAEMTVEVARQAALEDVVLAGGCFQNALLLERARSRLLAAGFRVYISQEFPPGDGGVALGQIYVAARQMEVSGDVSGNSR